VSNHHPEAVLRSSRTRTKRPKFKRMGKFVSEGKAIFQEGKFLADIEKGGHFEGGVSFAAGREDKKTDWGGEFGEEEAPYLRIVLNKKREVLLQTPKKGEKGRSYLSYKGGKGTRKEEGNVVLPTRRNGKKGGRMRCWPAEGKKD